MEDAPLVGVRDRRGQGRHQAGRLDPGHGRRPPAQPVGQRRPLAVGRGDVADRPFLPHLVHGHDVRVVEAGGRFRLAEEPPPGRLRDQDLGAGHLRARPGAAGPDPTARKTTPKPPRPTSRTIEKRPNRPGRSAVAGRSGARSLPAGAGIRARHAGATRARRAPTDRRRRPAPRRRRAAPPPGDRRRSSRSVPRIMGGS